jgi:AcrR family transcriptional regulator
MTGLRERKKAQTRHRITEAALRLFAERGFDAVTMTEIATAAEVSRASLFGYFPTKESLVVQDVGDDDLAAVVRSRPAGADPVAALRGHFRTVAAETPTGAEIGNLLARIRLIVDNPKLGAAAHTLRHRQRAALAAALAPTYGERAAELVAGQVAATTSTLQEAYFRRLADGIAPVDAARALAADVELAFDLLARGTAALDPDTTADPAIDGAAAGSTDATTPDTTADQAIGAAAQPHADGSTDAATPTADPAIGGAGSATSDDTGGDE